MKRKIPIVLFNASVILAGMKSPKGGSAKLLNLAKSRKISGVISEIILDEVMRNSQRLALNREMVLKQIKKICSSISKAPEELSVDRWKNIVIDLGDTHVLATANDLNVDYLVTLDQKHLLILQKKIRPVRIVSPKELIEILPP